MLEYGVPAYIADNILNISVLPEMLCIYAFRHAILQVFAIYI